MITTCTDLHERPNVCRMPTPRMTCGSVALAACLAARAVAAQARRAVADSSHFRPLGLPAPNEYRTASGRPGSKYWQQRVDYKITAELDEGRNELRRRETIHYANRSPDNPDSLCLPVC